jgi:hypothetical protein
MIKTYRELRRLRTFEERFEYLKIGGVVGRSTFGFERYINQILYNSTEWEAARTPVIIRDDSCDLGDKDRIIYSRLIVHHINPITIEDIELGRACVFDPDNLISTTHNTHQAIHYGDKSLLVRLPQDRRKGDTYLWSPVYSR